MKRQTRTKNQNLRRNLLDWLRLIGKSLGRRLIAAGRRFEPLPNEAPH